MLLFRFLLYEKLICTYYMLLLENIWKMMKNNFIVALNTLLIQIVFKKFGTYTAII
jgi:hypothetical protein